MRRGDYIMSLTATDAGHGGRDPGAVAFGHEEGNFTLIIAKHVDHELTLSGINNYLTRVDNIDINPTGRARKVKNSGAKTAISIHINAGKGTGFDVIYSIHAAPLFAQLVYDELKAAGFPAHQPGPYIRESEKHPGFDYYFIIRETAPVETIIVECGFIDNQRDLLYLKDPVWQKNIAQAIAEGEMKYLQARGWWKPLTPDPQPTSIKPHWAKIHNDELLAAGILTKDHSVTLDQPATEGMVVTLINKLRKEIK